MTAQRYSRTAIALHWLIAAAIVFQIGLGWSMTSVKPPNFAAFQLHKSIGITILLLTCARIAVRLTHRRPPTAEPGLPGQVANAVHALLYVFMIAAPLTGWMLVSTAKVRVPTLLFGTVPWPHLPLPASISGPASASHSVLAWIGIALIALHVAGALRHHLLLRDGLLARMWPDERARFAVPIIAMLVVAAFALGYSLPRSGARTADGAPAEQAVQPTPLPSAVVASEPTPPATATATPSPTPTPTASATPVSASNWQILPGGQLSFSVGTESGDASGTFANWSGTVKLNPDAPEDGADIRITVKTGSVRMGESSQQEMVTGAGYFESAAFPDATFTSTDVRKAGAGYTARGTLSIRGVKRPQTLSFSLAGSGDERRVTGSGQIARSPFGVGTGENDASIGGTVSLRFNFRARIRN